MPLIKLEIVADTVLEFRQALAGVAESLPRSIPAGAEPMTGPGENKPEEVNEAPKEEPRRRGRRPKAAVNAEPKQVDIEEAIEDAAEQETEEDSEAAEAAAAVSFADVKDALLALMEKKGDEAPVACLKEFGVSKISALKPEQHAEVVARARAMMEAKK